MEIVYDDDAFKTFVGKGALVSGDHPILIDALLENAFEFDVDALCDGEDVHIGAVMQHIEEAGIHSGDSACVLPPYKITTEALEEIIRITEQLALKLNVIGLINLQFAYKDGQVYVLEVNPRASRTVPFVSKATNVPLARIASQLAVGAKLGEFELKKWDHDGHYFGVYFPERKDTRISSKENISKTFYISSIVIVFITLIFAYAIVVILKQKRLSEVKTDFINNMTHEWKTPISTIGLSSEVLLNKDIHKDPKRIHRYAQIIKAENNRLENQVERVLQLAKLDKGEINLKKETINIEQLVNESVEVFRLYAEQNGGSITTSFNLKNSSITADKVHLTNIIHNLLDNANKYSPENPTIKVKVFTLNNGISVTITDNGKGINKEQKKLIFEKKFNRGMNRKIGKYQNEINKIKREL